MKALQFTVILTQTIILLGEIMPTIEQKIARKQDELNRLKIKQRKLDTAQKVVIGGMILSLAKTNTGIAKFILENASTHITRPADVKRIEPLLEELRQAMINDTGENTSV